MRSQMESNHIPVTDPWSEEPDSYGLYLEEYYRYLKETGEGPSAQALSVFFAEVLGPDFQLDDLPLH